METLAKLFGGGGKLKVIKLFIFNPHVSFDVSEIVYRTKETSSRVKKELSTLIKIGLAKKRIFYRTFVKKVRGKEINSKIKVRGFVLNENFDLLVPLHTFLVNANHLSPKDITKKFAKTGNIKLVIVSGVFIHDPESRVDLLVVGDNIKKNHLEQVIKKIEAEMGKELRYSVFDTTDFMYRLSIYDKLVRDILNYPHEKVVNRLGIS